MIAHELVHRWIGGEAYLVDNLGREATWFSEGFTVHFARRFLLEARLVAPRDLLADLRRTTGDPSDAEATCAEEQIARSPDEYRRGARYAAMLDRAIRHASHDSRSLDDLLRELLAEARAEHRHAIPIAAFRALVIRELGEPAGADFDAWVVGGVPIELPSDAFGPCFRRQKSTWVVQPCPGFP